MSTIDIHARHSMPHEAARSAANELAGDLARKFEINYDWAGDHIHFERPGARGTIAVLENEIHIKAKLGMLLLFLQPQIEQEVVRYLREHFGCTFY